MANCDFSAISELKQKEHNSSLYSTVQLKLAHSNYFEDNITAKMTEYTIFDTM